ncbi:MAG: CDP-glycerol glycerophosphotransferase family protein [Lachnospiraceae bacterium]|nr:CDP-glycerol glycerophosphotransferase family protein [Lachnospiraceae bacterium]
MKKILKNIGKSLLFHGLFPMLYRWHARKPVVNNSVLFIEVRYGEITDNFTLLYEEFCKREDFTVEAALLGNSVFSYKEYIKACLHMLKGLAPAEYVFVDESSNVLAALPIRKETKLVQVWHGCGAFKRFGYGGANKLTEKYYNDYYFTAVSSPEVVDIYAESMGQNRDKVLPIGVSRTDVFFNQEYIKQCNKEIRDRYNIDRDKRIILYAPTFRGNVQEARSPRLLDTGKLYDGLGGRYVILYKGHPAVKESPKVDEEHKDFLIDASEEKIAALMCSADCCITDYSSLIFEYALLGRPMYFYAYDYKEYVTERGFYYGYDEFVPGDIYYNEEELVKGILRTDDKAVSRIDAFRERYMSACDGDSTRRIIDRLLAVQ